MEKSVEATYEYISGEELVREHAMVDGIDVDTVVEDHGGLSTEFFDRIGVAMFVTCFCCQTRLLITSNDCFVEREVASKASKFICAACKKELE